MRFSFWLRNWKRPAPTVRRHTQTSSPQRGSFQPRLEALEDRTVPAVFNVAAGDVYGSQGLIADINAANKSGGTNTINLAGGVYDLTAVNNTTNGNNGLPVISGGGKKVAADNLTIIGSSGDIIQRDPALGPSVSFRLFDVASRGSLTLENVTLQNGLAFGSGAAADGGAIYNQGTLTLINTIVQDNTAQGSNGTAGSVQRHKTIAPQAGANAAGGGIWTSGTVKLESGTVIGSTNGYYPLQGQGNKALGGNGGSAGGQLTMNGGAGGAGLGGGLYQAGGSVTVTNSTLAGNVAVGGKGGSVSGRRGISGNGGTTSGGGLNVASGTLIMNNNDTVKTNWAMGGSGGRFSGLSSDGGTGGNGSGGGIYVGGGTVTLQDINLSSNAALGGWGGEYNFTEGVTTGAVHYNRGLGGNGLGGALYVSGGVVTMTRSTVTDNGAYAGLSGFFDVPNASPGISGGGGIYITSAAAVSLDSSTLTNTTNNFDYSWGGTLSYIQTEDDIDGSYTLG